MRPWLYVIGVLILASATRGRTTSDVATEAVEHVEPVDLTPLLQQSEDQFAYRVIAEALDRSARANQQLDALFFALMASVAAIYAIILDKLNAYPAFVIGLLLAAFLISIVGTLLSAWVEDAPRPRAFASIFNERPAATRQIYQGRYIKLAEDNDRFRSWKLVCLVIALLTTVMALFVATRSRFEGSEELASGQSERQRVPPAPAGDLERSRAFCQIGPWLPECGGQ